MDCPSAPRHRTATRYNFGGIPAEADVLLPPASYDCLQKIKATDDPDQTVIAAHPVQPIEA
jgi:hypothetical protein